MVNVFNELIVSEASAFPSILFMGDIVEFSTHLEN